MIRRLRDERGSTIPLILGVFVLAMLMVAGGVAAGDAFVQQEGLQSVCDGAAAAAASSVDLEAGRDAGDIGTKALLLGPVQQAVDAYVARDPSRSAVQIRAQLSPDRQTVSLACSQRMKIAFGAVFGKGDGIVHHATSTARAPLS